MKKIAVIGLGYVGLPLAIEIGKYRKVVGYDINLARIRELNENGYISKKEADKYSAYTLSTKLSRSYDNKDLSLSRNASYFNDQINRTIKTKYPKKF